MPDTQDQAAGLRRLLGGEAALRSVGIFGPDPALNAIATASLAFALARRGSQVGVLDEAPGPRNVAAQFGLSPRAGLTEVLRQGRAFDDVLATAPGGVRVLVAADGLRAAGAAGEWAWGRLVGGFAELRWDWMLLTAAAGEQPALALAAVSRVLVLPAARSRLPEAYAVLKAAQQRQPDGQWHVLVMNMVDMDQVRHLFSALADTARRFLGIDVAFFGAVPRDQKLDQAARAMRPLLEVSPTSPAAGGFRALAESMHGWPVPAAGMDAESFWQRLGLFSRLAMPAPVVRSMSSPHGRAYG